MDGDGEGRPEGSGEGRNEREDFSEYVEYLREKYGEGGGLDAEKVESKEEEPEDSPQKAMQCAFETELGRKALDDVASYGEQPRPRYRTQGGRKAQDARLAAHVQDGGESADAE